MSENFDALNESHPSEKSAQSDKDLRDQVVMESLGDIEPSSAEYVEEDDDHDAIAEGYK